MKKMIQKLLILAVIVTPALGVVWSHKAEAAAAKVASISCKKESNSTTRIVNYNQIKPKQTITYKTTATCKSLGLSKAKQVTAAQWKKIKAEIDKKPVKTNSGTGTGTGDGGNSGGSTSGGSSSADCATTVLKVGCDAEGGGIWAILNIVLNIMTVGVGILAMVGITIAAFTYATASDSMEKVQKSKDRIFQIVIGIIVYGALWALLQFLIPGGVL